jgi:hypothetical protein
LLRDRQLVLSNEAIEAGAGDPKDARRLAFIALGSVQDSLRLSRLDGCQGIVTRLSFFPRLILRGGRAERKELPVDDGASGQHDRPGESVLELSDVSRPAIEHEQLSGFVRKSLDVLV